MTTIHKCAETFRVSFQNVTQEESDMARLELQLEGVSHILFIITEALSVAIVLVFVLVLILAWQINR